MRRLCWGAGLNGENAAGGDGGNITISLHSTSDIYSYNISLVFDNEGGEGTYQMVAGKGGKPGRSTSEAAGLDRAVRPQLKHRVMLPCRESCPPKVRRRLPGERSRLRYRY